MGEQQTDKQATAGDMRKRPIQTALKKLSSDKRSLLALVIVIVIVLAGIGFFYYYNRSQVDKENQAYSKMITSVDGYLNNSNKQAAKDELLGFLKTKPKSQDHLYNVDIRLAGIYYDQADYKSARQYGEQAIKQGKALNSEAYVQLGDSCYKLNDIQAAITYYQKAVVELNKDQGTAANGVRIYSLQTIIGELKASQQK